jgi:nitrate/nitrite transporter NarK
VLLLNYYGRRHNLEIFSLTCLIGAVSALGPVIGGYMRDRLGSFAPTFQVYAAIIFVVFVATLFMRPPQKRSAGNSVAADDEGAPTLANRAA